MYHIDVYRKRNTPYSSAEHYKSNNLKEQKKKFEEIKRSDFYFIILKQIIGDKVEIIERYFYDDEEIIALKTSVVENESQNSKKGNTVGVDLSKCLKIENTKEGEETETGQMCFSFI